MAFQERTEAATPRRRTEARRRGQVARSQEIVSLGILLAGFFVFQFFGQSFLKGLADLVTPLFSLSAIGHWTPEDVMSFSTDLMRKFLVLLAPLLGIVVLMAIAANVGQIGFVLTGEGLTPRFNRINPFSGLQRIFSTRGLVELVKSIAKVAILGVLAYRIIQNHSSELAALSMFEPRRAMEFFTGLARDIWLQMVIALLIIAGLDYFYQRLSFERSIRMSRQELREELRQTEGAPEIRRRIRQRQRELARRRMMQRVPQATVVITNPTHYAVALTYDQERMRAPVVVAKGQLLIAEQIKRIARDHGVPVVENPPLARLLYSTVEIDAEIPANLYAAVAQVLAFVFRLRTGQPAPATT